ncbi:MAG: hypothetical protein DMF53_03870 [Acidobacteria bacterium]|nr:MAG: hypothetical protein DMF53_03870 [Acidobacteriota bacterium]
MAVGFGRWRGSWASIAARRAIYEDVVRSRFDLGPSPLTPDDFELQVVYLFDRWLVIYRKLWEASDPWRLRRRGSWSSA